MKRSKRIASLFLALVFALSLMATTALAVGPTPGILAPCPKCGMDMVIDANVVTYSYVEACPSGGTHKVTVRQTKGTCDSCGVTSIIRTVKTYDCGHCK